MKKEWLALAGALVVFAAVVAIGTMPTDAADELECTVCDCDCPVIDVDPVYLGGILIQPGIYCVPTSCDVASGTCDYNCQVIN